MIATTTVANVVWWAMLAVLAAAVVWAIRDTYRYRRGKAASEALSHARASNYRGKRLP